MALNGTTTSPPRPRHSGRRVLIDAGVVVSQVGVLSSSIVTWFFAGLSFSPDPLERLDYLHMTIGFALGSLLLLLGFIPAYVLECAPWAWATGALTTGACLTGTALSAVSALQAPPAELGGEPWWWPMELFVWLPMAWPMALLVPSTALVATARSLPWPPRPQDR